MISIILAKKMASNIRAAGAGYCHCYSVKEDHNGHRQDRTIVSKLTIDYI